MKGERLLMAGNGYKNSIGLGIKIQASKEIQDQLNNTIKQLEKNSNIKINLDDKSLNFSSLNKQLSDIQRRLQDTFNFNNINKSAQESAKTFQGLADEIGKLHEKSDLKINTKNALQEAKELNTILKENYQEYLKLENIKSTLQNKLSIASNNNLINPSVITDLQSKLNSINTNTAKSNLKELQNTINNLASGDSQIVRIQNSINSLSNRINAIKTSKIDIIDNNKIVELKTAENEVGKLKELLSQVKSGKIIDGQLISSEVNNARNSVNQLSSAVSAVKSNASALGTTFQNIFSYAVGGSVIYSAFNQLKQGLVDIKNVDDAMRDLKRVADNVADTTLNNFSIEANNMAKSLGNSTESVIQAVTTFKQLGYSWEQAKDYMAKESIILSNVGDMSAKDSADSIVATLKGFKLEAQDTTRVVDSLNEAGNKFAIRTGELAEGLRVSSAALAIANNDLYQSEALITAGTEVLRDSNEVGTGLKTISMRLDQVKSKGGETFFKLQSDLKNLANTELTNTNGSLRSTYDIILDLSKAWNSGKLDDMTKAKLLDETAGKQQAKVMASILQNASQLPKIYETLKNSAGSAEKEQARYMDSISGKLNAFKESIKAIWLNLSDSSAIKSILSGATSGVNGLNTLIQKFGAMPTVIMGVVGAMTIFNSKFRENVNLTAGSVIPGYTQLTNTLNNWKTSLSTSAIKQTENIETMKSFAMAYQQGGVSTKGMATQLAGMEARFALTKTFTA
jgi:TP901 family phage tail tape measure protein